MARGRLGLSVDLLRAAQWYRLSAEQNTAVAIKNLAEIRQRLTGDEQSELARFERERDVVVERNRQADATQAAEDEADAAEPFELGVTSIQRQSQEQQAATQGRINAEIQ